MTDQSGPRDDLYCAVCGYNLRGRDAGESCPECGLPVSMTVAQRTGTSDKSRVLAEQILAAAKAADVSRAAVALVIKSVRHAQLIELTGNASRRDVSGVPQIGCVELCDALIELVEERSRSMDDAKERLRMMGISTSGDVGRIVSALVERGLLTSTSPDELGQFDQLRTIETWLASVRRDAVTQASRALRRSRFLLLLILVAATAVLVWAVWASRHGR